MATEELDIEGIFKLKVSCKKIELFDKIILAVILTLLLVRIISEIIYIYWTIDQ